VDEVEAGLVAVEESELGGGGQLAEGGSEAVELGGGVAGGHVVIEGAGFDGEGAAQVPIGGDHFLDEADLDIVEGGEAVGIGVEELAEAVLAFVAQDHDFGEQAMAHGVARGEGFAARGFGTFGAGAVDAGLLGMLFGNHDWVG